MPEILSLIPDRQRTAVERALATAFHGAPVSAITPLPGGRSGALVYRVTVGGGAYVLRVVTRRDPLSDPARQFAAMRVASESVIAPRLHFADARSGIAISEFIESRPWPDAFGNHPEPVADIGQRLRQLHDGPALPAFLDAFQCIDQALMVVRMAGGTLPAMFTHFLAEFAVVRSALLPHFSLTASHNDLNPGNLLYDGERSWIIDWESSWQNDPMFDVATLLHWFGFTGSRRDALLRGYFGAAPTALQLAKIEAMRQVVSCYYAVIFLLLTLQEGALPAPLDPDPDTLPTFAETRVSMQNGTLPLETAEARVRFALVMINDARRAAREPGFAQAIDLLRTNAPVAPRRFGQQTHRLRGFVAVLRSVGFLRLFLYFRLGLRRAGNH